MLKVVGASWEQTRVSSYILAAFTLFGLIIIIFGGRVSQFDNDGNYAATVFWQKDAGYRIEFWGQGNVLMELPMGTARGYYRQDIANVGWSKVEIETNGEYPDSVQAYSAGLLEGSLTWQLVYWRWKNTIGAACEDDPDSCQAIRNRLANWGERMRTVSVQLSELDPFWHQVRLFYAQLDGLETGWNYALKRNRQNYEISSEDFLWLNFLASDVPLPDKPSFTPRAPSLTTSLIRYKHHNNSSNSTNSNVLIAQAKAAPYRDMLRIAKRYVFAFRMSSSVKSALTPGTVLTFTGYPGALSSQDDLYTVSSKHLSRHSLVVVGSGIGHGAADGYRRRLRRSLEEQVPGSLRALAACRLARDGRTWVAYFSRGRGGASADKQWSIVDMSKLDDAEATGLLWVVEQSHNVMVDADRTESLKSNGYWASFGLPSQRDVRLAMMMPDDTDRMYSYTESPRGEVFQQCRHNCTDKDEVFDLVRNAVRPSEDLIGARADLYQHDAMPFGIIDTKIVTGSRVSPPEFEVSAGPVYSANTSAAEVAPEGKAAPYQWSTSAFFSVPHIGHPDIWSFPSTELTWAGY